MPLTGYTFFCNDGVTETQVYPLVNNLSFKDKKDKTFGFYRRTLETTLVFGKEGGSYDYFFGIKAADPCDELDFIIKYKATDYFEGIIRLSTDKVRWDESNCRVTIQLDSKDNYTCFLRNWEQEINILTSTPKVEIIPFFGEFETITCQDERVSGDGSYDDFDYIDDCITGQNGWLLLSHVVAQTTDEIPERRFYISTYIREIVVVDCDGVDPIEPPGSGWILEDDNCPTDATYVRAPSPTQLNDGELQTGITVIGESAIYQADEIYRVERSTLNDAITVSEIDNGVLLSDILDDFYPCDDLNLVISAFFSHNEDDVEFPDNVPYQKAIENLASVIVYQKSDIKRASAFQNATNGVWTYKSLLEHLKFQYNIEFRIDNNGNFLLEHTSFFEAQEGLDLTLPPHDERILGKDQYEYDGNVPASEKWSFMEQNNTTFDGVPITYTCFSDESERVRDYQMTQLNNNLYDLIVSPDRFSDQGFCFVNAYLYDDNYYLVSENSELNGTLVVNGHQSIPNLLQNYHTYMRPFTQGTLNNVLTAFDSSVRRRTQTSISIKMSPEDYRDLDASELMKTNLGWGEIEEAEYLAADRLLTVILKHE